MAVDPLARFAYVLNAQSEDVSMYTINSTTGSLVPTPPPPVVNTIPAGPSPFFIAVHPSGGFTYVVTSPFPGLNPPTIFVYTINATTGALTPTTPIAGGGLAITIHPSGNFAYVIANGASGPPSCGGAACTSTYMVNATTGTLTLVGSVLTSLASPVVVRPSGKFAYALSGDFPNTVVVFAIDDITGKLTLISTASTRLSPSSVAVDAFGKFAYVTNHGANNVTAYTIDATTGALTEVGTVSTGSGPMWITVERSGKFAYVLDSDPSCLLSSISIYKIDGNTGLLLPSGKACANDGIGKMLVTSGPIP